MAGAHTEREGEHWRLGSETADRCLWATEKLLLVLAPDTRVRVIHELIVRFNLDTVRFIKPPKEA